MMHHETDVIQVPGAKLRYVRQGAGPLLVLIAGGDADAAAGAPLATALEPHYTVLTYDRRGLSGSTIDDPEQPPTLTTHADDVHHLLAALTTEPALVYGSSIGAMISLELAARHPEQIRLLVAHEPPATQLLPEPERAQAAMTQREIEETFQKEGAMAALRKFLMLAGIDPADREEDAPMRSPNPGRIRNMEFFLAHDAPAVGRHRLDLDALKGTRIVPAVGANSGQVMANRCALLLAERLGLPYAVFPGGHNGSVFRPKAFAARLHEVLETPPDQRITTFPQESGD